MSRDDRGEKNCKEKKSYDLTLKSKIRPGKHFPNYLEISMGSDHN